MIPRRLRITGFLSYLDPVELDFDSFELACISGANGAGKSSLLDAMTWALFGQARRKDDAIINSAAKSAEVVFDFWYEDNLYRIQRSKPAQKSGQLQFFIRSDQETWKSLTEHTLRDTEEQIERTLRLDYDTFINASFFLQGKADQFAQQRPGDRKRILSNILGLEQWEVYHDKASERRKHVETDLTGVDSILEEIHNELMQENSRRERLKQLEDNLAQVTSTREAQESAMENMRRLAASLDAQRKLVSTVEKQLNSIRERIRQCQEQLDRRRQEQDQYQKQVARASEIEAAYQNWQSARQELEKREVTAANFREHEKQRNAPLMLIESERSRLEQERQQLADLQAKVLDAQSQLQLQQAQYQKTEMKISQLSQDLEKRPGLESRLQNFQKDQLDASAENKSLKVRMNELRERIDRLAQAEGAVCPLCGKPLSPEDREALIASLEVEGKEMGDHFRSNTDFLRRGDQQRQELEVELNRLRQVENELHQEQRAADQSIDRQVQIKQLLADWESNGALRQKEVQRLLAGEEFAQEARVELTRIDAKLKLLGYDAAVHDTVRRAEQEGRAAEGWLRSLENARAALSPLEGIIADLEKQLAADEMEAASQNQAYQDAVDRYNLDAANLPDLNKAESDLFALKEQENRLRTQVGGALQEVEVLKSLRTRQADLEIRRVDLARQITRLRALEKAFSKDGVPALLIEQALPEIETQANQILEGLTDGAMSVHFVTQKDYKDKNREDKKETLDILISDVAGIREYEMFSGGEAFRINFAIRLALSRVLAQRAGARLQTLVIDEGFGSQDTQGRQRLVEAINQVRGDFAKILVITHLEDLKDHFPARIEVEKTPRGSTLRLVI